MRHGTALAGAVTISIVALLLPLTAMTTLWDRDEARFGQAAVEMLATGNYLLPTFNGELRPQKPPLAYWLMTLSLRMFGHTEFAVRFWSPIALGVAAFSTFVIGRRLWSPEVGVLAMLILASTPLTLLEGVAATADALLLATTTVSVAMLARTLERALRPSEIAVLGAAFGLGALAKGPVAIVVPLAIATLTHVIAYRSVAIDGRTLGSVALATAIGVALFAVWFIPATLLSAGRIATAGLLRENLGRFLRTMEGHGTPIVLAPLYYPAVIVVGFVPWIVYLPRAVRHMTAGNAWRSSRHAFLAAWIAAPLVIFTLSATKLPHYILPAFPALALMVSVMLASTTSTLWPVRRRARQFLIVAMIVLAGSFLVAPALERHKPVPVVMDHVRRSPVAGPLYAFAFEEPSLAFYGRRPIVALQSEAALLQWARLPGEALLVAPRGRIDFVEHRHGSLGLRELGARAGWNYVKGERIELVAFARPSDR